MNEVKSVNLMEQYDVETCIKEIINHYDNDGVFVINADSKINNIYQPNPCIQISNIFFNNVSTLCNNDCLSFSNSENNIHSNGSFFVEIANITQCRVLEKKDMANFEISCDKEIEFIMSDDSVFIVGLFK